MTDTSDNLQDLLTQIITQQNNLYGFEKYTLAASGNGFVLKDNKNSNDAGQNITEEEIKILESDYHFLKGNYQDKFNQDKEKFSDKKELIPAFERWLKENPVELLNKLKEKGMDSSKDLTFSIHSENGEDSLKIKQGDNEIRLDYKEVIQDNLTHHLEESKKPYANDLQNGDVSNWDPWGQFLNYLQTASPNENQGDALKTLLMGFFTFLKNLSEQFQDQQISADTFEESLYENHYDTYRARPTVSQFMEQKGLDLANTDLIQPELDYLRQQPDVREQELISEAIKTPSAALQVKGNDLFITIPPFFADCGNEDYVTLRVNKNNINKPINDPLHPTESEILQNMGYTPLHIAAKLGDFNMMSQLQNIGADPMIMAEPDPLKPGSSGLKPFQIAAKHVEEVSPRIQELQSKLDASMGVPGHKKDRARWRSEINMIKNGRDLPKIQKHLKELAQTGQTSSAEYLSLKAEYDAVIARKYAKKSAKDRADLLSAQAMKDKNGKPVWDNLKDANGHPVIRSDMYEANCTQGISAWSRQPYTIHNDPTSGPIEKPIIVTVHEMNLNKPGYWTDYEAKKANCSKVDGNRYVTDDYKNSGALKAESGNSYQFLCNYHNKVRTGKMEPVNQANSPKAPDVSYRPGNNASKVTFRYDINPPDKGEEQSSGVFHSGVVNTK